MYDVAREIRSIRIIREGVDFGCISAVDEVDERIAGHFFGEPGATVTQDAALTVKQYQFGDRNWLFKVTLLFNETRFTRTEGQRLILQRTLAALVAHGAIERVVYQQEFKDAVLGFFDHIRLGINDHAFGTRLHTGRLKGHATGARNFNQTHPTHAHFAHAGVPAEPGDVGAMAFCGSDQQLTGVGLNGFAVNGDCKGRLRRRCKCGGVGHGVSCLGISHVRG